ncbi:efflux RND transporter periplasmic adaptor subunit [Frigoriglobus tundricola]|nr:HlyD family efflux transporter periplasmic adaptor subunit [Frigoriglobus tundricola]
MAVLGVVFAVSLGWELPGLTHEKGQTTKAPDTAPLKVELVKDEKQPSGYVPNTLAIPPAVQESLGILRKGRVEGVAVVTLPLTNQTIEFPGSTAVNPAKIARIKVRFPTNGSEVTSIGKTVESFPPTVERELRTGDTVKAGQVLADFYSVDVGSKKNDLIDAVYQLKLDQEIYDRAVASGGAVPEVFVKNAYRAVVGDLNAIDRAVKTLQTWNVPQEDIDAVRKEAEEISKQLIAKPGTRPTIDPEKEKQWGKVSLRSPISGVILERNITANEIVIDNTVNIFQIANVDDLLVIVNVPEDYLPRLRDLQKRGLLNWTIQTAGAPIKFKVTPATLDGLRDAGAPPAVVEKLQGLTNRELATRSLLEDEIGTVLTKDEREHWQKKLAEASKVGLVGPVNEIGYLIDPNTHTAILKGPIKNENRALRAGQGVIATIDLPREENVVEVPMAAIADDGRQTVVFVQPDPAKPHYTMQRVKVTHRFDKIAYVSSVLTDADIALGLSQVKDGLLPFSPLKEGDRVLTTGILDLKKELDDRQSALADSKKP